MRDLLRGFAACLVFASTVAGQAAPAKPSSTEPSAQKSNAGNTAPATGSSIDPVKEADIRRLLEITGAKALVVQSMADMSKSIKPALTNSLPPGDYREKLIDLFFEKFLARANTENLLELAMPSYDKSFTHDEIRGLIKFYETPLGKKAVSVMPQLMSEMQEKGRKWGENLGRQCMQEVIAEHPEFEKALVDAQKKVAPSK